MAEHYESTKTADSESPQAMDIDDAPVEQDNPKNIDVTAPRSSNGDQNPVAALLSQFRGQVGRLEDLERRVEQRVLAARRRTVSLMVEQWGRTTRQSHLRLYLSHSYAPEVTPAGAMAALMKQQSPSGDPPLHLKPCPPCWTLHVEGRLLVDHLDHAAAAAFDREKGFSPSSDELDRTSTKGEEDEAPDMKRPLKPTHFFDRVKVTFQTVYAPIALSSKKPAPALKKKPTRRGSSVPLAVPAVEPRPEVGEERILSLKHHVVWNRVDNPDPDDSADIWCFPYYEPPPPVPHKDKWRAISVTAFVELYRRSQYATAVSSLYPQPVQQHMQEHTHTRYRIVSTQLQSTLFPHHGPETTDLLTGKKRNANDTSAGNTDNNVVPLHNEVYVPHTLTMTEIANAFFIYIRDRKLVSTQDVVHADDLLQSLLGMEQFSFSQLQQLLQQQNLVEAIRCTENDDKTFTTNEPPVQITYILEPDAASVLGQAPTTKDSNYSLLQLDLDVAVPSLAPYRCRELLRRVKRRELEYTSSRPKARYLLPNITSSGGNHSKDDDERWVRLQMDRATVSSSSAQGELSADAALLIPLQLALAKAAPPKSEARQSLYLDAAMGHVVTELRRQVQQSCRATLPMPGCSLDEQQVLSLLQEKIVNDPESTFLERS